MANSLRSKLSKLRYKGEITQEEYSELIKKLDGHDSELLDKVAEKLKDNMCSCSFKGTELCDVSGCGFDLEIDSVHKTIDEVIAEMKAEIEE